MGFEFLPFLSGVFGWVYTLCWSLSFYPQPLLNYRRHSTSGTTIDFPLINCLGFLAYLVSNYAFRYSSVVRGQYAARHHGLTPTVQFNDIAFAAHALVLSLITTSQYLPKLWGFPPSLGHRPSRTIVGVMLGCVTGVVVIVFVVAGQTGDKDGVINPMTSWCWLDVVYAVGYVKLVITLVKYSPQVLANYRNRSTKGWSIWQILLDFSGGVLSLAQLGIDSYLQGDWSGVTGNPVKLALGNVSMLYDLVFFTQHYVLYPREAGEDGENDALLASEEGRRRRMD